MAHPYIYNAALAVALTPGLLGLNALFRPESHLRALGFPSYRKQKEAHKLNYALMRIWGIRNVVLSFLVAVIWTVGDATLLGTAFVGGLAVCITDGFVSRALIGGGEGQHWGAGVVMAGLIAGLYGWY